MFDIVKHMYYSKKMGIGVMTAFLIAGHTTGIDPALLSSLCYEESKYNTHAFAEHDGHTPSFGLCQIKLKTARELGYRGRAVGLMDAETNALYAAKYLAKQKKRWGTWARAISAYNAGHPARCNQHYVQTILWRWEHELRERRLVQMYR